MIDKLQLAWSTRYTEWRLLVASQIIYVLCPSSHISASGSAREGNLAGHTDWQLYGNLTLQRPKRPRRRYLQPAWLCGMLLVIYFRTMYLDIGKAALCHTITPPPPYS